MSTTLPLYWNLSSPVKEERIDASVKLVGALQEFQSQYIPSVARPDNSSDSEPSEEVAEVGLKEIENDIDVLNAEDVRYASASRTWLASPRESSRLGFAVALTELLACLNTVSSAQIISLIVHSTQIHGSMQGHEVRDQIFARLFGLVSVIQSGLLWRESTLPTSQSGRILVPALRNFQTVCSELFSLGERKSWLRESCWWAIGLVVDGLEAARNKIWTPEKLAFALNIERIDLPLSWEELLAPMFKGTHLLATRNLPTVARILRVRTFSEAPLDDEGDRGSKSSGAWKPQLHYVWGAIFKAYFSSNGSKLAGRASFQDFFRVAVDESLFSATASAERKSWGFSVIERALEDLPPDEIPFLFTQNFMRTWINHLSNQDRFLHKAARHLAGTVQGVVDKHPAIGFTLVLQLLGRHGNHQFDRITKTKTVESIITSMNIEGVEKFIEYVKTQVYDDGHSDGSNEATRLWATDQFTSLMKSSAIPKQDKWVHSVLEFFVVHGFFSVTRKNAKSSLQAWCADRWMILRFITIPNPKFSDTMKQRCRDRLFTCLAELSASDSKMWLIKVLDMVSTAEADIKHVKPLVLPSPELRALRGESAGNAERLRIAFSDNSCLKLPASRQDAASGASVLLISLLIETYDPTANVQQTLKDSVSSVERLFTPPDSKEEKKKKKPSSVPSGEIEREAATAPIDEIIDIHIGFLEARSAYSRTIAKTSFSFLTGEVQRSTVDHILTQLEPRDVGDNPSDEEEEDDTTDINGESDESSDAGSHAESLDDDTDTNNSGEDSSEDEGEGEPDLELRQEVSGHENDEDEEDEEMMDDDQMLKMDEQLAAVFRMQRGPKLDKKRVLGLQRAATHFKIRVLDLIEVYVRKHPDTIRGARADEEQFSGKATNLLENRGVDGVSNIVKHLEDLHQLARSSPTPQFLSLLARSSIYISRVLSHGGHDIAVAKIYQESLCDFISRKGSRLNTAFFHTWVTRYVSTAWHTRTSILDLCKSGNAVNRYRQMQAFQLLHDLFSQAHLLNEASQKAEMVDFLSTCRETIYSTLTETSGSTPDEALNANHAKQVLKCALLGVRLTKRVVLSPEDIATVWDVNALRLILEELESSERGKNWPGVISLGKQLLGVVSPSPSKASQGGVRAIGVGGKRKVREGMEAKGSGVERDQKRKRRIVAEISERTMSIADSD
ncbi:hypothetical protein BS47DRAFT_1372330 [Hydnum rufescens UP504]|uniref:Uncharacterized protein n=1 Tax=Hydnum rufescens UP504 TaxID=1448309 RepID=A0A9P6AYM1_9AGAM|nr:hypothetical protein BS47DRAFT_1372330 [Hydnum rufescens UP504]